MTRLAGIVRRDWNADAARDLETMRARLCRHPSGHSGTWIRESLGVGVAWVSDADDRLPVANEPGDRHLFFRGELFANDDLPATDPGEIVRLYEHGADTVFEHLNGGFSGILVDSRLRRIVLFNDRYGSDRLYWHADDGEFHFASEANALLTVKPHLRRLDSRGLGEFLTCGCVLQNRTLFEGISILPAGACWTFDAGGACRRAGYFSPEEWESQPSMDGAEFAVRLRDTLKRVVPRYLRGASGIGVSLTGGVDSRLLLALGDRREGLPCYTFAGPYGESADLVVARRVADECGLTHRTIRVGDDFLRRFPALAEETVVLSDGAMDVSGAVELYVNERAREIAPVRLTGNYGSEILRSYVAFAPRALAAALFEREVEESMNTAQATYVAERRGTALSFIAFKQVPWHHFARSSIERSQLTMRSPYLDNELVRLAFRAPSPVTTASLLRLAAESLPAVAGIPTDRGVSAHAVPLISPLVRLWREAAFRAEYAYDYGMPQWLARADRRLARLRLERLFLGRHKFYHFRIWYRDLLADFVRTVLLDPRSLQRPYVNARRLRDIVAQHTAGEANYTVEIHKLLTLELLQRRLLDAGCG